MNITQTPRALKTIRDNLNNHLKAHGLHVKEKTDQGRRLIVCPGGTEGRARISLLCPRSSTNMSPLIFPIRRSTVESLNSSAPWLTQHRRGLRTGCAIPEDGFVAIPVPGTEADFWIVEMNSRLQREMFRPLDGSPDDPEPGFFLATTASVDGVAVSDLLAKSLNNFERIAQVAIAVQPSDELILKFTLPELEQELRQQLETIGLAVSFHFNVGQAAHLSGNPVYIENCHNDKFSTSSFYLHAADEFEIADLEDYAITFQVRRLYAFVFENRWDNLLSTLSMAWENIDHAINRLDDFVRMAELPFYLPMVFDCDVPGRLRALSLMAKARLKTLGKVPVPFAEFAALAQISERSMTNLVSKNGALNTARLRYNGKECIDTLKALDWIDRRPLFHRAVGRPDSDNPSPFALLTVADDGIQRLWAEIIQKIAATLADGGSVNDYLTGHGYAGSDGEEALRRAMKNDFAWFDSEDNSRDWIGVIVSDIEKHHPDFPNRKQWLWAIRYCQYFGG